MMLRCYTVQLTDWSGLKIKKTKKAAYRNEKKKKNSKKSAVLLNVKMRHSGEKKIGLIW